MSSKRGSTVVQKLFQSEKIALFQKLRSEKYWRMTQNRQATLNPEFFAGRAQHSLCGLETI